MAPLPGNQRRETKKDEHYGYHTYHPLLKLLNLRDNLLTFKQAVEETISELWWRFKAIVEENNFSLRECKQGNRHEGVQSNDTSSLIQQKLDEHDKKLNDMKDNIDMLNEVTTSNSMTIPLKDAQLTHLMTDHYPPFTEDSPNYTMGDFEDKE
uniref:Uncharacterized protein n=1 Tax=Solanum tuberosum TaxID=4113 RepID=M1DE03_SOLTU